MITPSSGSSSFFSSDFFSNAGGTEGGGGGGGSETGGDGGEGCRCFDPTLGARATIVTLPLGNPRTMPSALAKDMLPKSCPLIESNTSPDLGKEIG